MEEAYVRTGAVLVWNSNEKVESLEDSSDDGPLLLLRESGMGPGDEVRSE